MPATNPFSNQQKAGIFVRDRATCSFSGANLWLLDAPLRVGWQSDWVDHKKPLSRGGISKTENGACASHTFNMKKRNNSADTAYLFENGHPTSLNYMICGAPPASTTNRLRRLARLDVRDWYLNRTICWILEALNFQWWSEPAYKRTDENWFDAAFKKLLKYRKLATSGTPLRSLEERGIISSPTPTQEVFLSLRECDCPAAMRETANQLSSKYARNSEAWWSYFHPEDHVDSPEEFDTHRKRSYDVAKERQSGLDTETFHSIESDYKIRYIPI